MVRAEAPARLRLRRLIAAFPLSWLDVFADTPLAGNQLAVVHDADGVGEDRMLAFAREMKLSETTFVQSTETAGADYRNRIWDLRRELPFAGHPTLGTAVAIAHRRGLDEIDVTQETGAGLQPVRARRTGDRVWEASMLQNPPEFGPEADIDTVLEALGLEGADADAPPRFVSTGLWHLMVTVDDADTLDRVRPDWAAIAAILDPAGAAIMYLAHVDGETARARAFTHSAAMGEDPATGSAAGPLCAHVADRGGPRRLEIVQGVEMGRPSRLVAALEADGVRVDGGVHLVAEGTAHL